MRNTVNQQQVIDYAGKNLLVSAAAGSGKTTVMIERIVRLITEGASLDQMAVVTFTNDSAADMRLKLSKKLSNATRTVHIQQQLKNLAQAEIGTLHSWCSKLIKVYFYATDVDPDYEILDEYSARQLLAVSVEKAITEQIESGNADFALLYDCLLTSRKHRPLAQSIMRLYNYSRAQQNPQQFLLGQTFPSHNQCLEYLYCGQEVKARKLEHKAKEIYCMLAANGLGQDAEQCEQLIVALTQCKLADGKLLVSAQEIGRVASIKKTHPATEIHEQFKLIKNSYTELVKQVADIAELAPDADTQQFKSVIIGLTNRTHEIYTAAKRRNTQLDYSDLEHETLKILCSEYGAEIAEKYTHIFVDEYQDINPLQDKILSCFSGASMFYVGDVKQSIYGFRMCDPRFFINRRDIFSRGNGGEVISLNQNFRSGDKILSLVNDVFSPIMTRAFGAENYATDGAFNKEGGLKPLEDNGFTVAYLIEDNSETDEALEDSEYEQAEQQSAKVYSVMGHEQQSQLSADVCQAHCIIGHIHEILQRTITENDTVRPVAFSDIAVLVKSRGDFTSAFVAACKQLSIAVDFSESAEIEDYVSVSFLHSYLKLIDNANDDISLTAVMLSFFGGFNHEQLGEIRAKYYNADYFYEAALSYMQQQKTPLAQMLKQFFAKLNYYREKSKILRADELAGLVTAETDYFKFALSISVTEAAALEAYMAKLAEPANNMSLFGFISYCTVCPELEVKGGGGDAIRLMTIHGSKGLEFPFVILADLSHGFNYTDSRTQMLLSKEGFTIKKFDMQKRETVKTSQFVYVQKVIARAQLEEQLRLLYVATTRAKVGLSLFALVPKRYAESADEATSYADFLIRQFSGATVVSMQNCIIQQTPKKQSIFAKPNQQLLQQINNRVQFVYPYEDARDYVKTNVTKLLADTLEPSNIRYQGGGEADDRAIEIGNAYHKFMQEVDFFADFNTQLSRISTSMGSAFKLLDANILRGAVADMATLAIGKKVFKELPFIVNQDGKLIQGIIDLLIVDGNTGIVVDYKTGNVGAKLNSYSGQLEIYAQAVKSILGITSVKKVIYGLNKLEILEIS